MLRKRFLLEVLPGFRRRSTEILTKAFLLIDYKKNISFFFWSSLRLTSLTIFSFFKKKNCWSFHNIQHESIDFTVLCNFILLYYVLKNYNHLIFIAPHGNRIGSWSIGIIFSLPYLRPFLLLTLNIFHTFFQCFYPWLWTCNCFLGSLSQHILSI